MFSCFKVRFGGLFYFRSVKNTITSKIDYLDKLKMNYFTVLENTLTEFSEGSEKSIYNQRFIITVNNTITWRGGTVSLGNNSAYITLSKHRMKKLGLQVGDSINVELEKDNSKYGFDVPEEFTELLKQDIEARTRFEALNMGFQRSIIYMVIQFKTSDKRIEKSIFFLENLKKSPFGNTTMRHIIGKENG